MPTKTSEKMHVSKHVIATSFLAQF